MAILSTLLSVSEPSGAWISVIKAFEAVTNNYVLAIIFLTVVLKIITSVFDTFSKYSQQKMNDIQSKIQPELEKIKQKYANQPQIIQQKQNELYRKHFGKGYYGSCIITMLLMILNLVIFLTLFSGLNLMSSYKISLSYDNLKYTYANCLNVTDVYFNGNYQDSEKLEIFKNYEKLSYQVIKEDGIQKILLIQNNNDEQIILAETEFKNDFSIYDPENPEEILKTSNESIIEIIDKIFPTYTEEEILGSKEIILIENYIPVLDENGIQKEDESGNLVYQDLYLSTAVQKTIMNKLESVYNENKDSFLWVENIWIADSPFQNSIVDYNTLVSQIGKDNIEEGEEKIYNCFMDDLKEVKNKANGYYILPLLCVLISVVSLFLINPLYSKIKCKRKGIPYVKQRKGQFAQIIIVVLFSIFALFYNTVFTIYMITGQLVATLLSPLQLYIVDKIVEKKKKKEEDKITVEYSRKF